jgi:hypothetical protein
VLAFGWLVLLVVLLCAVGNNACAVCHKFCDWLGLSPSQPPIKTIAKTSSEVVRFFLRLFMPKKLLST